MSLEAGGFNLNKKKGPDAGEVAQVLEGMKKEMRNRNLETANDNDALEIRSADDLGEVVRRLKGSQETA